MKNGLGGKVVTGFIGLSSTIYSYLIDDGSKDKKNKRHKECHQRKLKFENYKNCLEASQLKNKINYLEKNKFNIVSLFCYKIKHNKFIKNNELILKTHQRFKSETNNVFTEKINKID